MKALASIAAVTGLLAAVGPGPEPPPPPGGLNVAILVDVTASLHRCPEGVAGLVSSTLVGSGTSSPAMKDRSFIPPAVGEFPLAGMRKDDRVRVGAIARRTYLSEPLVGGSPELKTAWRNVFSLPPVEWLGSSPLWDALSDVADLLSRESGFRTIVLISDGQATGNLRSAADAAATAVRLGVRVSVIGEESIASTIPPRTLAQQIGKDPTDRLRDVAEQTGGRFFLDKAIVTPGEWCYRHAPGDLLAKAIADLRARADATSEARR